MNGSTRPAKINDSGELPEALGDPAQVIYLRQRGERVPQYTRDGWGGACGSRGKGYHAYPSGERPRGTDTGIWFDYRDAKGRRYLQKRKYQFVDENGSPGKRYVLFHHVNHDGFDSDALQNLEPGAPDGPQIPYHLNVLTEASADAVFDIAEGERDADSLFDIGFPFTSTNWGGAGQWVPELNPHFAGHPLRLWEDNDRAGYRHMRLVARQLKRNARSVEIIRFREFPEHSDVSDFIELRRKEGKTTEEIREELLARAVEFEDFANPDFAKRFLEKAKSDPAAPFKPEIIEALASLKIEDTEAFQRLWANFKGSTDVAVGELKKLVDKEVKALSRKDKEQGAQLQNFEMTDAELLYHTEEQSFRICDAFEILGECRDTNGGDWGLLIRFRDRDGKQRRLHVGFQNLHSDANAACAVLSGAGLAIEFDKHALLAKYLCAMKAEGRVRIAKSPGWIEIDGKRAFVLPEKIISRKTIHDPVGEEIVADFKSNHKQQGTLDDWKNGVATLVQGHYVPMFAVCAAFVGPLLNLLQQEGGGIHLHSLSGHGKTTSLSAAASVWGSGATKGGFMQGWSATGNGLEAKLAASNDTLIVLDEVNTGDGRTVSNAAYTITNGMGRQRMTRTLEAREVATWNTWLVSSGEVTLEQKIVEHHNQDKAMAGQLARILDIPADCGNGFGVFHDGGPFGNSRLLAEAIGAASRTAYGTAGPAFVRGLIGRDADDLMAQADAYREAFLAKAKCLSGQVSHQVVRVAKKFALIAYAGKLAVEFGILPWEADAPEESALWAFKRWLERRGGGAEETEEIQAVRQVQFLMEQHSESRFQEVAGNAFPVNNRLGFRKKNGEKWEYYVLRETWREVFCKGFDPEQVAAWLEKRGMLQRPKGEPGFQSKKELGKEFGRPRVYVLTHAVLEHRPPAPPPRDMDSETF